MPTESPVIAPETNKVVYDYKKAFKKSKEYFDGDELAAKVFLDKYALRDNDNNLLEETPDQMHWRLANEFARIEKSKFKNPLSAKQIFEMLDHFKRIVPQGSPMYGVGNNFQIISLANCFGLASPVDSYGGIHWTDQQLTQISKRRGGCGVEISTLRPNGSPTQNSAKSSTGAITFAERFSNSIREVAQNGRRGALMIIMSVHHPEIREFAMAKRNLKKITGANISVRLSDEFLKAVERGIDYELRFPVDARENGIEPKISRMVDARSVWNTIVESAHAVAEPGILFWDNIIRESPADCYADLGFKTVTTNPCSELSLSALGSCHLLLLNMLGYVKNPWTNNAEFDFDNFYKDAQYAERLMDDLIDMELEKIDAILAKIESDPEPEYLKYVEKKTWEGVRDACVKGRRTGCGITALGDALAALGISYGSEKAIQFVDKSTRTLKLGCYRSSVDIAREIGAFPIYDPKREETNPFIQRIAQEDPQLYKDMIMYGRRNIGLLTISPAGSVSILTKTTSGVEPLFSVSYKRRKKVNTEDKNARIDFVDENNGDSFQEFIVFHPQFIEWAKANGYGDSGVYSEDIIKTSPWYKNCAEDLDWSLRVELQGVANKNIDHSISSTCNLPKDITAQKVGEIYLDAWKHGLKGITVYVKDCRCGVLVDGENKAEPKRETLKIHKTQAPKRPLELPAEVHHVKVRGKNYYVIVGMLNKDPYEVFAGENGQIEGNVKTAKVTKEKRGHYKAVFDNGKVIDNIAENNSEEEEALTRMTSCSLRHGADISFVVHQLEKTRGDLMSFSKAMARTLKKHIQDGVAVTGETCPNCDTGKYLARKDGCIVCQSCGWTRCN